MPDPTPPLTDADIETGLRLDAALMAYQGQWGTSEYDALRDEFDAHALAHYADALREVRRLREELVNKEARLADSFEREIALRAEAERLHAAIVEHHQQKADDRCVEDDDSLYAAAGLPPCDRRVGDKAAMLANCARFIDRRCEGGKWPSYAELEALAARLVAALAAMMDVQDATEDCWCAEGGPQPCEACACRAALADARAAGLGEG